MTRKYADTCAVDGCSQSRHSFVKADGRRWHSTLCKRHYAERANLLDRLRRRDVQRLVYVAWRDEALV